MRYEVEQKFLAEDLALVEQRLTALQVTPGTMSSQVDQYFGHPARDFATTDEALRLRRVGEKNFITYKGPKIDVTTKTRHEIELPLQDGDDQAFRWAELLRRLGFEPVAEVRKRRQHFQVAWEGAPVEVALDQVEGVGTYVELEVAAEEADLATAKARVQSLAHALGLTGAERRSYLELLRGRSRPPGGT
jgi:adenylate cyclase class 2